MIKIFIIHTIIFGSRNAFALVDLKIYSPTIQLVLVEINIIVPKFPIVATGRYLLSTIAIGC